MSQIKFSKKFASKLIDIALTLFGDGQHHEVQALVYMQTHAYTTKSRWIVVEAKDYTYDKDWQLHTHISREPPYLGRQVH
jgi:hypothetical protein